MRKLAISEGRRFRRFLDHRKSSILLGLLLIQTSALLYLAKFERPIEKTVIPIDPGRNYSLLVDSERFPIQTRPHQEIRIEIYQSLRQSFHTTRRVIIPQYQDQNAMSSVGASRFRFYYDRPNDLKALFIREHLKECLRTGDWETILATMNKVNDSLKMGLPLVYPPQNALRILDLMRNRREEVFCAQYCYVTVQFLQAIGFFARHITIDGHEVCEVWVPSERKWVCLDPTHNAYFVDSHKQKLSALQIAQHPSQATPVSTTTKEDLSQVPGEFDQLWFWLTNNLATHPVNIYDLNKYRVRALVDKNEIDTLQPGDLYTLYPTELYDAPS